MVRSPYSPTAHRGDRVGGAQSVIITSRPMCGLVALRRRRDLVSTPACHPEPVEGSRACPQASMFLSAAPDTPGTISIFQGIRQSAQDDTVQRLPITRDDPTRTLLPRTMAAGSGGSGCMPTGRYARPCVFRVARASQMIVSGPGWTWLPDVAPCFALSPPRVGVKTSGTMSTPLSIRRLSRPWHGGAWRLHV
jgi:hypothetical protein